MSKTWKKTTRVKDCTSSKGIGRGIRVQLSHLEGTVPNGCWYKKLIERWDWNDYNFVSTPAEQSHEYHHPLSNWNCMCDSLFGRRSWWRRINADAPEPVLIDRNWALPEDYEFSRRYNGPVQRVNPETGDYEFQTVWEELRYYGHKPCNMLRGDIVVEDITEDEDIVLVAQTANDVFCKGRKAEWKSVRVEGWAPLDEPKVYRIVEAPYFTAKDVQDHVKHRERQTRNYRMKEKFPRYGRRDRKRARNLKRSSGFPGGL